MNFRKGSLFVHYLFTIFYLLKASLVDFISSWQFVGVKLPSSFEMITFDSHLVVVTKNQLAKRKECCEWQSGLSHSLFLNSQGEESKVFACGRDLKDLFFNSSSV